MDQQEEIANIIGTTIDSLIRRRRPGGASFVALCYSLAEADAYTAAEVQALATRFLSTGEGDLASMKKPSSD